MKNNRRHQRWTKEEDIIISKASNDFPLNIRGQLTKAMIHAYKQLEGRTFDSVVARYYYLVEHGKMPTIARIRKIDPVVKKGKAINFKLSATIMFFESLPEEDKLSFLKTAVLDKQ